MILFSSDHHYHAYPAFGTLLAGGVSSRLREQLDVESALTRLATVLPIHMHVRCGDLFETKNAVDAVTFAETLKEIRLQTKHVLHHRFVKGNHEEAGALERSTLEYLYNDMDPKLSVVLEPGREEVIDGDMRVGLHYVPYDPDPARMQAALDAAHPFGGSNLNVLVFHGQVDGVRLGSEYRLRGSIKLDHLAERWDLVVGGHIHEPQELLPGSKGFMVGSLTQRDRRDIGAPRRVLLLDSKGPTVNSLTVPGPRFEQFTIACVDDLDRLWAEPKPPDIPGKCPRYVFVSIETDAVSGDDLLPRMAQTFAGWRILEHRTGGEVIDGIAPDDLGAIDVPKLMLEWVRAQPEQQFPPEQLLEVGYAVRRRAADGA